NLTTLRLSATHPIELATAMAGRRAVLSALSFDVTPSVARAAHAHSLSYFDLTEDVSAARAVKAIAAEAVEGQIFMPQCGLAPGFVSIAAYDLTRRFE